MIRVEYKKIKAKILNVIFFVAIFLFFVFWFSNIHPIVMVCGDDWVNIINHRKAIPIPFKWNPIKVMPETLMPLFTDFAMYIIYPITKNMCFSITLSYAIVTSIFIIFFCYSVYFFFNSQFEKNYKVYFIILFIILLSFLVFKTTNRLNIKSFYLFYSYSPTELFNYMLPNLLNVSLFLYIFESKYLYDVFLNDKIVYRKMFFMTLFYFAIFSNLYSNIVVTSAALVMFLYKFIITKKIKVNCIIELIIVIMFIFSLIIEYTGGRAHYSSLNQGFDSNIFSFLEYISKTFSVLLLLIKKVNVFFLALLFLLFVLGIFYIIKNNINKYGNMLLGFLLLIGIILIFDILLSAKINPNYISDIKVIFNFFILLIIIEAYLLHIVLSNVKWIETFLITFLFIIFTIDNQNMISYCDQGSKLPNSYIDDFNFLKKQYDDANYNGLNSIDVYIPNCYDTELSYFSYCITNFFNKYSHYKFNIEVKEYFLEVK